MMEIFIIRLIVVIGIIISLINFGIGFKDCDDEKREKSIYSVLFFCIPLFMIGIREYLCKYFSYSTIFIMTIFFMTVYYFVLKIKEIFWYIKIIRSNLCDYIMDKDNGSNKENKILVKALNDITNGDYSKIDDEACKILIRYEMFKQGYYCGLDVDKKLKEIRENE